jgi:fructose-1,6-bisphosphatase/inositol monophosphatase family enzyme
MTNMLTTEEKLELERIYKEYGICETIDYSDDEEDKMWNDLLKRWIEFRIRVSGGADYTMGSVGCGSVDGFLNEIDCVNDMAADNGGCYRGDFIYECTDALFDFLDNSSLSKETIELIKKTHNERHFEDEEI